MTPLVASKSLLTYAIAGGQKPFRMWGRNIIFFRWGSRTISTHPVALLYVLLLLLKLKLFYRLWGRAYQSYSFCKACIHTGVCCKVRRPWSALNFIIVGDGVIRVVVVVIRVVVVVIRGVVEVIRVVVEVIRVVVITCHVFFIFDFLY